ncbi:MAG: hypothetical protein QXQ44_02965 [Candidatus Caldarchaeum sp.]
MKRRSAGLSAVVGTAIGLMIFFTVVIPMWIYMQNIQTLFMDEVSRRMRLEIEKVNERLELQVALQPPELHPFQRSRLFLYVVNKSPVEVDVPVIYIESNKIGLQRIDRVLKIAPGERIERPVLDYVLEPDEVVVVRLPTLRGNSFATGEIGPTKLPYMMIVQVNNASFGQWVNLRVEVVNIGDVNKVVGCVAMATDEFATGCRGHAEIWKFVSSPDDLSVFAGFAVSPGRYQIRVLQCSSYGSGCVDALTEPAVVNVVGNVVVEVRSGIGSSVSRPLPLRVKPLVPLYTYVAGPANDTSIVTLPFILYLGNNTEPLFNVKVSAEIVREDNLTSSITQSQVTVYRISPGETYFGSFELKVVDESDNRSYGGYLVYRLTITEAVGQVSRTTYDTNDFQMGEAEGTLVYCRWWIKQNTTITSCRTP